MTTAHDLMIEFPEPLHASTSLRQALEVMLSHHDIRNVPVVDDECQFVGLVSQRELNAALHPLLPSDGCACVAFQASLAAPVAQLMATDVQVVNEDTDVLEISELMVAENVVAVPVVNAHGKYLGMISCVDVMHELALYAA